MTARLIPIATLFLSACTTPTLPPQQPLDAPAYNAFLSTAKDPRFRDGITTYHTPLGPYYKDANRVRPERYVLTPFLSRKFPRYPIFSAKPRTDSPLTLLLDTSSRINWARYDLAPLLDYTLIAPPDGEHPDHVLLNIPGYAGLAQRIRLENFIFELPILYLPVAHGSLGPLARHPIPPPHAPTQHYPDPDVILGCAALENISYLRIDYPAKTLRISSSSSDYATPPSHTLFLSLPLVDWNGRPAVIASIDESQPLPCVIDTAGDFDLSIPAGTDPLEDPPQFLHLGNHNLPLYAVHSHHTIGLPQHFPPRIGARLLSRYTVVLDRKNKRLLLELPRTHSPPPHPHSTPPTPLHYRGLRNAPAR